MQRRNRVQLKVSLWLVTSPAAAANYAQMLLGKPGVAEAQTGVASRAAAGRAAILVGAEQQGAELAVLS